MAFWGALSKVWFNNIERLACTTTGLGWFKKAAICGLVLMNVWERNVVCVFWAGSVLIKVGSGRGRGGGWSPFSKGTTWSSDGAIHSVFIN